MRRHNPIKMGISLIMGLATLLVQGAEGDADALTREINSELRAAERLIFDGKKEEADVQLEAAGAKLAELTEMDPDISKLRPLQSKYERTRATLDKLLGRTTKPASSRPLPPKPGVPAIANRTAVTPSGTSSSSEAGVEATTVSEPVAEAPAKLPGGVSKRLRDIDQALDRAESELAEGDIDQARYQLETVPDLIGQIERMYGGQFSRDHPEFAAMEQQYAEVQAKLEAGAQAGNAAVAAAAVAQADQAAQAEKWLARFGPFLAASYMPAGHQPSKLLVFPGTAETEKIPGAKKIFDEGKALYAEFLASGLAEAGVSSRLDQAASDLKFALDGFESSLESAVTGFVEEAKSNLQQAMDSLSGTKWKTDPEALPPMIPRDWMERMEGLVSGLKNMLSPDDPVLPDLQAKLATIARMDRENRKAWQERIRVRPERYSGKDLHDLRSRADEIVAKDFPGSSILRISIYQDDWKEESVIESTDSTNTAVRHRVTRLINAQVAAQVGGETHLHTLHIAKDKRSDGSWGPLYGHVMHSDRMLAENIGK